MIKKSITRREHVKAFNLLSGLVALLIVLSFSTSFTNSAFAIGSRQAIQKDTLTGEVVVVDNLHHLGMLTLQSSKIGQFPNDQLNIFMNKTTSVKVCSEREPEKDIKVNHKAIVTYHEVQGLLPLADSVSEKC